MQKIEQLKWFYGSLAGICAAFFFTMLGTDQDIGESHFLYIATVLFGILLPIFSTFTIVHIIFIEEAISENVANTAIGKVWVGHLTSVSLLAFYIGFTMVVCHVSKTVGILFLLTSALMWYLARGVIFKAQAEHNKNI